MRCVASPLWQWSAVTLKICSTAPYFLSPISPVDFFFMLEFVLAHAYGRSIEGDLTVSHFIKARLIRFYPLYLIGLAIATLAMLIERSQGAIYGKIILYWTLLELFFLPIEAVGRR
jgi:peptidoglycan/LPS O-acetylase OafA/YrhL